MLRAIYVFILVTLSTHLRAQAQQQPAPTAYHIIGRCHDYGTALGLKASIYAVMAGTKQKLSECNDVGKFEVKTGTFDVRLPVTATHLIMEMPGYRTVTVPVHFTPGIPSTARFSLGNWCEMTVLDSLPKPTDRDGNLSIFFTVVDSLDVDYTVTSVANADWKARGTFFYKRPSLNGLTFPTEYAPGNYIISLSTRDGRFISSDTLAVSEDLTFTAVRIVRPTETRNGAIADPRIPKPVTPADTTSPSRLVVTNYAPAITAPSTATLYFDQSSPDLRPQVKASLDSLAPILMAQPGLLATVTGYTDNVGQRGLNLTLSEYRARAVATYLTTRGVPSDRLVVQWKGPDSTAASTDSEAVRTKSRRVVVRVAPR